MDGVINQPEKNAISNMKYVTSPFSKKVCTLLKRNMDNFIDAVGSLNGPIDLILK